MATKTSTASARPFLKWAGGKTQILDAIDKRLPEQIKKSKVIKHYVEPFVGGGAVFFHLAAHYTMEEAFLYDINRELIVGYEAIKHNHLPLIDRLREIENEFLPMEQPDRKAYFYNVRDKYNEQMLTFDYDTYSDAWIGRAAWLIFLNKTCYNGLFRQNNNGEFNVPYGKYVNPTICDKKNIQLVHRKLQCAKIFCADFTDSAEVITGESFVYFDPPYRPLNKTSSFTGYFKDDFDDNDQRKLAQFFHEMDKKGAYLLLSNSDPKNEDPSDTFFEELYDADHVDIVNVQAKRSINSNANKRGAINELIIRNY